LKELEAFSEKDRRRFLLGEFTPQVVGALWTFDSIQRIDAPKDEKARVELLNGMKSVVVSIDPSGCTGPEDERSDEIGIVVCGKGYDGNGYVLADLSGYYSPEGWGKAAVNAYDKWQADMIVGEQNYGGDMVSGCARAAWRRRSTLRSCVSGEPGQIADSTLARPCIRSIEVAGGGANVR
jgi:phage terminase large subunit-like protein